MKLSGLKTVEICDLRNCIDFSVWFLLINFYENSFMKVPEKTLNDQNILTFLYTERDTH